MRVPTVRVDVPVKLVRYAERELGRVFRESAPGRVDLSIIVGACALEGITDLIHAIGRPRVGRAVSLLRSYLGWYVEVPRAKRKAVPMARPSPAATAVR